MAITPRQMDSWVLTTTYSTTASYEQHLLSRPSIAQVISPQRKVYALKRIRLTGLDTESAQGFVDEIHLLRRLKGKPSIIQLVDAEVRRAHSLLPSSSITVGACTCQSRGAWWHGNGSFATDAMSARRCSTALWRTCSQKQGARPAADHQPAC